MNVGTQLFRVPAQSHAHTCEASGEDCTAAAHTRRNRRLFFPRTDGCPEYTLPQKDAVLINLTYRVTELPPQAVTLCLGGKYTQLLHVKFENPMGVIL